MSRATFRIGLGAAWTIASVATVVGTFAPWYRIDACFEVCSINYVSWNALQIGGGFHGPSAATVTGVVLLTGAAVQGAGGIAYFASRNLSRLASLSWSVAVLGASIGIVAASLLAQSPKVIEQQPFYFLVQSGVGRWVALVGGAIGLVSSGAAILLARRPVNERSEVIPDFI